jgi:hypothetical protein
MIRRNHYEAAFAAYLRAQRLCFIAVNESKRSSIEEEPIKSLDFVVTVQPQQQLLIDIKGRKFPGGSAEKPRPIWQNWCTLDDINGLSRWQEQYGSSSTGLLVFMYHLLPCVEVPLGTDDLWVWKRRRYLLRAMTVQSYREAMRIRSPKWRTVHLRTTDFRERIRPLSDWLASAIATK